MKSNFLFFFQFLVNFVQLEVQVLVETKSEIEIKTFAVFFSSDFLFRGMRRQKFVFIQSCSLIVFRLSWNLDLRLLMRALNAKVSIPTQIPIQMR